VKERIVYHPLPQESSTIKRIGITPHTPLSRENIPSPLVGEGKGEGV